MPQLEIPGDAAVLQPVAVVQPFLGDRGGQHRPVGLGTDPTVQLVFQLALAQEQVLGFAHFQIGGPEIGERGLIRSVGSNCLVQLSHWSPRASSKPQLGQVPST